MASVITFDIAIVFQLYLHGHRHYNGDTVAGASLPRPSWGTSSLRTIGTQVCHPEDGGDVPPKHRFL
jgi:hypothetical protein